MAEDERIASLASASDTTSSKTEPKLAGFTDEAINDAWKIEALRLRAMINTPEVVDFAKAVHLEAIHQRERWGSRHDVGKNDADWFWLIGYLAGKALHNPETSGLSEQEKLEKRLHRVITIAAAAANWHHAMMARSVGSIPHMRPGIDSSKL